MALPIHEKSGMANATPAIPLLPPLCMIWIRGTYYTEPDIHFQAIVALKYIYLFLAQYILTQSLNAYLHKAQGAKIYIMLIIVWTEITDLISFNLKVQLVLYSYVILPKESYHWVAIDKNQQHSIKELPIPNPNQCTQE